MHIVCGILTGENGNFDKRRGVEKVACGTPVAVARSPSLLSYSRKPLGLSMRVSLFYEVGV